MKEICDKEVFIKSQTLLFFSFCYKRRTLLFLYYSFNSYQLRYKMKLIL